GKIPKVGNQEFPRLGMNFPKVGNRLLLWKIQLILHVSRARATSRHGRRAAERETTTDWLTLNAGTHLSCFESTSSLGSPSSGECPLAHHHRAMRKRSGHYSRM